jgi:hypothetical protein
MRSLECVRNNNKIGTFLPARRLYVRTTRVLVLLCCSCSVISQNTAILYNFTMLSAYCTIPCSLARQPCPAALLGSLSQQPCPAALPGSLARQPCPAALPGSLARQPCRSITSFISGTRPAELQAFFTAVGMQYYILLPAKGRQFSSSFPRN